MRNTVELFYNPTLKTMFDFKKYLVIIYKKKTLVLLNPFPQTKWKKIGDIIEKKYFFFFN